jgi:hypothetical protein
VSKSKVIAVLAAASPCDVGAMAAGATLSVGLGAATSSQFISAKVTTFQHRLADGAATVQGIEDRDAVRSADAGLAVESERPGAQEPPRHNRPMLQAL